MKHPQTLAEKLYVQFPTLKLQSIKKYACCAFTFMWCMGIEPDDAEAIILVGQMIDKGVIDSDCTVYWSKMARHLCGRDCSVEKPKITSIDKIKKRTPVYYVREYRDDAGKKKKAGHWVGVENGKICFNSLENSLCVKEGKPVEARYLTFSGGN